MSMHPVPDACARVDELIEPYLDGDLDDTERRRTQRHFDRCMRCDAALAVAERIRSDLRALPARSCPPHVAAAALAHARAAPARRPDPAPASIAKWRRLFAPPESLWRPALALAAVAALAIGLEWRAPSLRPIETATPAPAASARAETASGADAAEIARAEADVKLALAYLGKIGARTGDIVRHEVIERRVASPLAATVRQAFDDENGS